jgi:hypothetical protein
VPVTSAEGNQTSPRKPVATGTEDLQKAAQNPVASIISVPIQNNSNFGIGPFNRVKNVLNIQPVVPVPISRNWNLIVRWIAPIIWQPAPGTANLEVFGIVEDTPAYFAAQTVQRNAGVFGFGDMTPTFFFSPAKPHKVIWGAGPVFVLPTATSKVLGQGKLSMGPSFVALVQPGRWRGRCASKQCLVGRRPVGPRCSESDDLAVFHQLQPEKGLVSVVGANCQRQLESKQWQRVDGGVGRVFRLGFQPVNASLQVYRNVVHPSGGAPWGMRLQIAFLFPEGTPQK